MFNLALDEKTIREDEDVVYSVYRLMKVISKKIPLIVAFVVIFSVAGFGIAKVTYEESYGSKIMINVANKDKDIAGAAADYVTASDAQASATIANNFKLLVQQGDDFIIAVQDAVKAKTGTEFSKKQLRSMISVETVQDSTIIKITASAGTPELAYAVSTSIQSVYPKITKVSFQTANFTVADSATQPELKSDSSTLLYTAAGFVVGFGLAVLFVLIQSKFKNTVLSSEDIKESFNLSIIASISKIKSKKGEKMRLLITDKNVGLPFIETFKLIRTKIENVKLKKGYSVFSVTSSTEGEGKTTCSSNIALSLAKTGKSVLLIDADLRKPAVYKTLGISLSGDEKGVYDIVSGKKTFEEAVKYVEKYNLYLLLTSSPVSDPSEVLASKTMENIVKEAKKNFDYVIVDCPPAGIVADAAIVSNYTDSIIFVTSENKTSLPQVEYALSDLLTTKAEILGCIYNMAEAGFFNVGLGKGGYYLSGYGGYYGSYYGSHYSTYYGSSSHSHSHSRSRRSHSKHKH